MCKTMFMASGHNRDVLCDSGKYPWAVQILEKVQLSSVLHKNTEYTRNARLQIRKGKKERDYKDSLYACPRCHKEPWTRSIGGRPFNEVTVCDSALEAVVSERTLPLSLS